MTTETTVQPRALVWSADIDQIAAAYVLAQASLASLTNTATAKVATKGGGSYSYSYITLADVFDSIREPLTTNGLAIMQGTITDRPGGVTVQTRLLHTSGQWVENSVTLHVASNADAQQVGSTITYARRYGLLALLGLASANDDDDGARASAARPDRQQSRRQDIEAPAVDPFDDPARPAHLCTREEYNEVIEIAHGLTEAERRELSAWREQEGIAIKVGTLTSEQVAKTLEKIASMVGVVLDEVAPEGPLEATQPLDLESLPTEYSGE